MKGAMGQALYRKYRSKSLDEIVGQEHITKTLKQAIKTGRVSHAYLFTGPRGVGKTSIARILAHELNGVPYETEDNHLDIIEIDAASNGGVEEVRDLRDKVYIAPASGRFKVYIIDEVHMMTTSAFNALLKTLEEPPAHAIFILATTEAHKLPATIISRTQRFTFKPIPSEQVVAHLRHIANKEKIDITDDALGLIAEHGGGSFRDSISMLDQASSSQKHIDRASLEKLLGIPPATAIEQLITALRNHDVQTIVTGLTKLRTDGYQAAAVAKQLGQSLRNALLDHALPLDGSAVLAMLARLIDVPASHNPDQLLELVLLSPIISSVAPPNDRNALSPPAAKPHVAQPPTPRRATPAPATRTAEVAAATETTTEPVSTAPAATIVTDQQWQTVLNTLKQRYNTLYGIIRMARPEFLPGTVKLTFGFAFHQKRANDIKNRALLAAILQEATGSAAAIECLYDKTITPPAPVITKLLPTTEPASAPLEAINNIFGGSELLES